MGTLNAWLVILNEKRYRHFSNFSHVIVPLLHSENNILVKHLTAPTLFKNEKIPETGKSKRGLSTTAVLLRQVHGELVQHVPSVSLQH